jgi:glycine cleavage system H protein
VESTKSVSEIYAPLSGHISSTNGAVVGDPALLNSDPYGSGWLFALEADDPSAFDALLDATSYEALVAESATEE